jgi:hypothetical protein
MPAIMSSSSTTACWSISNHSNSPAQTRPVGRQPRASRAELRFSSLHVAGPSVTCRQPGDSRGRSQIARSMSKTQSRPFRRPSRAGRVKIHCHHGTLSIQTSGEQTRASRAGLRLSSMSPARPRLIRRQSSASQADLPPSSFDVAEAVAGLISRLAG